MGWNQAISQADDDRRQGEEHRSSTPTMVAASTPTIYLRLGRARTLCEGTPLNVGAPTQPGGGAHLRREARRPPSCGQVGAHLRWLLRCDDLDVGLPEPAGVVAADDGQAVGGQHGTKLGRHHGVAAAQHGNDRT